MSAPLRRTTPQEAQLQSLRPIVRNHRFAVSLDFVRFDFSTARLCRRFFCLL